MVIWTYHLIWWFNTIWWVDFSIPSGIHLGMGFSTDAITTRTGGITIQLHQLWLRVQKPCAKVLTQNPSMNNNVCQFQCIYIHTYVIQYILYIMDWQRWKCKTWFVHSCDIHQRTSGVVVHGTVQLQWLLCVGLWTVVHLAQNQEMLVVFRCLNCSDIPNYSDIPPIFIQSNGLWTMVTSSV